MNKRGFTLIELLVVIAIIGLLAAIVLASLGSARSKGRDARRVADLKQMANAAALADNGTAVTFVGGSCSNGNSAYNCTTPPWTNFKDPSSTAACNKTTPALCDYTLATTTLNTQNFEVCNYLESGSGSLAGNININITQNATITSGCP